MKRLVTVVLLGVAVVVLAQAPPREVPSDRAPSGGFGAGMQGPERDWGLVCFVLKVDTQTLEQLRPLFQQAWDDREGLLAEMRQQGGVDRAALMEEMAGIQGDLEAGYRGILTAEQLAALDAARQARTMSWGGRRGRPSETGGRTER